MDERTIKQLKEELVTGYGFSKEDSERYVNKASILAIMKAIDERSGANFVPESVDDEMVRDSWTSKSKRQYEYWKSQPKIKILVPLEGEEKTGVVDWVQDPKTGNMVQVYRSGAIQTVIENGARFFVPKGVYVDVPEPVAKLIQEKYAQTNSAGKDFLADRKDPVTGVPVSSRLT